MAGFIDSVEVLAVWTASNSWRAVVLVALVLVVQRLTRGRVSPRWHYALWFVVIVRLIMPAGVQSGLSVFNWVGPSVDPAPSGALGPLDLSEASAGGPGMSLDAGVAYLGSWVREDPAEAAVVPPPQTSPGVEIADVLRFLPIAWACGAALLGLMILLANWRLLRAVRRQRTVTDCAALDILESCKEQMGVKTPVALVATSLPGGPALFGFIRPRLLIPETLLETLDATQLRHVFMHELAHLKRNDIVVNWLAAALQVLHWFNPVIWYAFHRMRADRELACDALAMTYMDAGEVQSYGYTLVGLFESRSLPHPLPGVVGIVESKTHLKRRITMIASFTRPARHWSVLAMALLLTLILVGLTDATEPAATPEPEAFPVDELVAAEPIAPPEPAAPPQPVEPMGLPPDAFDVETTEQPVRTYQVPPPRAPRDDTPRSPQLLAVLALPVNIEFEDIHLSDIAEFISDSFEVNLVVDSRAVMPPAPENLFKAEHFAPSDLFEAGYVTDGVTRRIALRDIPLAAALEALLRPLHLDYALRQGYLFISSPQLLEAEGLRVEIGTLPWKGPGAPVGTAGSMRQPDVLATPFGSPEPPAAQEEAQDSPRRRGFSWNLTIPPDPAGAAEGTTTAPATVSQDLDSRLEVSGQVVQEEESTPRRRRLLRSSGTAEQSLGQSVIETETESGTSRSSSLTFEKGKLSKLDLVAKVPPSGEPGEVAIERQSAKLDESLARIVDVEFEDLHLRDFADYLSDSLDINVVIDNRAVAAKAADALTASQVTDGWVPYVKLEKVRLGDALSAVLKPLGLAYTTSPDFIWITTPKSLSQESFEELESRFYQMDAEMDLAAMRSFAEKCWQACGSPIREPSTGKAMSYMMIYEDAHVLGVRTVPARIDAMEKEIALERAVGFEHSFDHLVHLWKGGESAQTMGTWSTVRGNQEDAFEAGHGPAES